MKTAWKYKPATPPVTRNNILQIIKSAEKVLKKNNAPKPEWVSLPYGMYRAFQGYPRLPRVQSADHPYLFRIDYEEYDMVLIREQYPGKGWC